MTFSSSKFEVKDAIAEAFDDEVVREVVDLVVQVLDPIDQNSKYFLKIRPGVVTHIARVTRTLALDEEQTVRNRNAVGRFDLVETRQFIMMSGI